MIPWPLIAALALLAIAITALMAIIAVGHQTEERPGTIDLTGIRPRAGYEWPSASRVRAEAASGDWDRRLLEEVRRGREVFRHPSGATVIAPSGAMVDRPEGFERLSEYELAVRVAQTGGSYAYRSAPINELQRANGCVCPDMDTLLGSCPVHNAFLRPGGQAA